MSSSLQYIGIDEAGRGPWAGPIVACAVYLRSDIPGLNDSKQLTARRRDLLVPSISAGAVVGIGWVQPGLIDRIGLTQATSRAMLCALRAVQRQSPRSMPIVIDGSYNYLPKEAHVETVVKADASHGAVAAASIIAKERRDAFMASMDIVYPGYGFARHAGYGTQAHKSALADQGITPLHRKSFRPIAKYM